MSSALILDDEYPEVLADIAREIHKQLMEDPRIKLAHPLSAEIALKVAEHVRKNLGGFAVYIPRGVGYESSLRERKIFEEFKGDNYQQLAQKFDLSEMRVRQIVAHGLRIERAKRQIDMFSET